MQLKTFLNLIPKIVKSPLQESESQLKMIPPNRLDDFLKNSTGKNPKKAAVICLCFPNKEQEIHFVLILRNTYKGVHSGQIGFPGGKIEATDSSCQAAAIRELKEEIGVKLDSNAIIKALTPIYIPPSNFMVSPYLAFIDYEPVFIKDDYEVNTIISIPIDNLLQDNIVTAKVQIGEKQEQVPAFQFNKTIVWGATARILYEVRTILKTITH